MLLWAMVAVMTAAAVAAVLWPLVRRSAVVRSDNDVAVYRDQLQEIDRDLGLGLIGRAEAEAARIEVSRRLLAASERKPESKARTAHRFRHGALAGAAVLLLTAGAGALYLRLGTPSMASEPVQAAAPASDIDRLVTQAEDYLSRNPQDARGWEVLGPVYMRLGRYGDSANAWRNVVRLAGANADRLANLGEALTAEANGIVTDEAKDAFTRAVALDQGNVTARYYIAIAAEQDGKRSEAAKQFKELLAQAPDGAHWAGDVRAALARVEGKPDGAPIAKEAPHTDTAPPQDGMIRGMVERLAERLKQDGSDPDGWIKLVRSYNVLKDDEHKRAAIEDAHKALAGDVDKLAKLEAGIKAIEAGEDVPQTAAVENAPAAAPAGDHDADAMVARLAERLTKSRDDAEGWLMLTRSYATMKQPEKAKAAIRDARTALAGDPEKLDWFNQSIKRFKLEE